MGHRGQERGVGLDQQPVERAQGRGLPDVGGVLEGDHPAERQRRPEIEAPAGLVRAPR